MRNTRDRIYCAVEQARALTEELVRTYNGKPYEQAGAEGWLEEFTTKVEDAVDAIDADLETQDSASEVACKTESETSDGEKSEASSKRGRTKVKTSPTSRNTQPKPDSRARKSRDSIKRLFRRELNRGGRVAGWDG